MDRQIYEQILKTIEETQKCTRLESYNEFKLQFRTMAKNSTPIPSYDTFTSIYGQLKRRSIFKTNHYRECKENISQIYSKYKELEEMSNATKKYDGSLAQNLIIQMAQSHCLTPALMSRLILDSFSDGNSIDELMTNNSSSATKASTLIKETHLFASNERLANEIQQCCAIDDDFGPQVDVIKNLIGLEYEIKLERFLKEAGLFYVREEHLRQKGFDKTPDFLISSPIIIPSTSQHGHRQTAINWIESKASFGDEPSHAQYYEDQYKSYINRFGPGLVIYWFGFLEDLVENKKLPVITTNHKIRCDLNNNKIMISDQFPKEFVTLKDYLDPSGTFIEYDAAKTKDTFDNSSHRGKPQN